LCPDSPFRLSVNVIWKEKKRLLLKCYGNADLLTKIVLPSLDKLSAQNNYLPVGLLVPSFLSSQKKNRRKKRTHIIKLHRENPADLIAPSRDVLADVSKVKVSPFFTTSFATFFSYT